MNHLSQARLFWWLRARIVRNGWKFLGGHTRVRILAALAISAMLWIGVFIVGYMGFSELRQQNIHPGRIIGLAFNALFAALGGMLVFSTSLVLYAGLFNGAETRFLLATPARADQVYAMKFQSSVGYSSWAFLVLGAPLLIAYGIVFAAPWYFYALIPAFVFGFVVLPGAIAGVLCLLLVNFFPHRRKQALAVIVAVVVVALGWWIWRAFVAAKVGLEDRDQLQGLFDMFALMRGELSPSEWMANGLMAAADRRVHEALLMLAMIWANGLMLYCVSALAAKYLYRRGLNRMSTGGDIRRRYGGSFADRLMEMAVFYLDRKTRLLIVKDFRTFRREPAQIGQVVVFTGLLILAVLNTRQFFSADVPLAYQQGLSLLNMTATGLLVCAYLSRFVYPLISLEGRKFWVLGLMPIRRDQLLWGKFCFAITGSIVLAGGIILMSDIMLGMAPIICLAHFATVVMLACGLSGLSVGISACLPNFRETDPAKIVLGFGGTVNMLIGLAFLVVTIAIACGPLHLGLMAGGGNLEAMSIWSFVGLPVMAILAAIATVLPMRIGARAFRAMEW